jgi:hypothetical protein
MRISNLPSGPYLSRLWVEEDEFEEIALALLRHYDLLPAEPAAVNIELLTEKLFGFSYEFAELPRDQLGQLTFGPHGPESLTLHSRLDTLTDPRLNQQCRSTLAHECGHGVLHTRLYRELWKRHERAAGQGQLALLLPETAAPQLRKSRGQWWEYQANRITASLLLPATLVLGIIGSELAETPYARWPYFQRRRIVADLADAFDVTECLAQYRLEDLVSKSLRRMRAAALRGKSYAPVLALCWPATLGLPSRKAA